MLPEVFPHLLKVLWLDADTIVLCDVAPLVRSALSQSEHAVAAVPRHVGSGSQVQLFSNFSLTLPF